MRTRILPTGGHRAAAIRRLLDQNDVDPAHRITVTVCCDQAVLTGEADTFADKDAALSATLRLGDVTAVSDRVRVRPRPGRKAPGSADRPAPAARVMASTR